MAETSVADVDGEIHLCFAGCVEIDCNPGFVVEIVHFLHYYIDGHYTGDTVGTLCIPGSVEPPHLPGSLYPTDSFKLSRPVNTL